MIVLLLLWGPPTASVERLRDTLQSYGPWAIVISAGLMIAQAVIAPIPGNVITITNGLVFGPFWGGLLSWGSILIGSTLCFGISKLASTAFTKRIVGAPLERAESFFRRHGLQAVFLVRITPLVPFDAVSYAAGLVGVPFPKFILATAIGIIPSIIVYSYIGAVAVSAYWGLVGVLFLALLAVAVVPRFLRKKSAPCAFPIQEPERTAAD
jgi:uncharacterized membrane protein YdjX (TVP38/TMEM64 family)